VKSTRLRRSGDGATKEEDKAYGILMRKPLGKPRKREEEKQLKLIFVKCFLRKGVGWNLLGMICSGGLCCHRCSLPA
jgi:hypothetical protein